MSHGGMLAPPTTQAFGTVLRDRIGHNATLRLTKVGVAARVMGGYRVIRFGCAVISMATTVAIKTERSERQRLLAVRRARSSVWESSAPTRPISRLIGISRLSNSRPNIFALRCDSRYSRRKSRRRELDSIFAS